MKTEEQYIEYLNELYDLADMLDKTEHCWAGNDKKEEDKMEAYSLIVRERNYGECLKRFDPVAFNVGFNEWQREQI